jgi:transcriptional regulator with PAS, ATPase and Fis domain
MVTGESGTGKELAAKAIHDAYGSQDSPFIRVNCPAIPKDLLESELFGHRRGAFTGAIENRKGAFVSANGGTLFLDEIGDLPLNLQPKLLHVVEQKRVTPVGGTQARKVRLKIVAATNRDLEAMVAQGTFRRDLFYRLDTLHLHLQPLRQRVEDIEELASHFLIQFANQYGGKPLKLDQTAIVRMQKYQWPGNIRELRNILERGCLQCQGKVFNADLLSDIMEHGKAVAKGPSAPNTSFDLAGKERGLIVKALEQSHWNQSRAAQQLGITRNTLRYRIKKYGMRKDEG